jgi:hypothetical protein
MDYTYRSVDAWLRRNEKRMIECPLQPGQLKISRDACTKRYWIAQEDDLEGATKRKDSIFALALAKSLSLCRDCPIGKHLGFMKQNDLFEKRTDARREMPEDFIRSQEELTHVRG